MDLWLKIPITHNTEQKMINGGSFLKMTAKIGSAVAAKIEARDTYLHMAKITTHTRRPSPKIAGESPDITPAVVATPLPPLNFKKTFQI